MNFKINTILTLIHRAYNICSSYASLHNKFETLKTFFEHNGYPRNLFYSQLRNFLEKRFSKPINNQPTIKDPIYLSLPYFGSQSDKLKIELRKLLGKFFPNENFRFILTNNFTISSLFHFKDRLPKGMRGSLVYKFSCVQCTSMYVGSTSRTLISRAAEHAGRSPRTNKPLVNPSHSSIRCHGDNKCSPDVSLDTFEILDFVSNDQDLRILNLLI